ncbi:MAG: hypothetical protein JNK23_04770 [Opitutaceae bacterium]|nr:hypothetical protein [Opitutaceae bacterium]
MHLVIDQNSFRLPDLALNTHLSASPDNVAVVTDTALFEMLKGSDPVYAATRSFEVLKDFPEQAVVTAGTGELIRQEIDTKKLIETATDVRLTGELRKLLVEIKKFTDGKRATFPLEAAEIQKQLAIVRPQRIDTPLHKTALVGAVGALRKQLPEALRADARNGRMTDALYEFIYLTSFVAYRDAMATRGLSEEEAKELFLGYALGARLVMMYQLSIFGWFESNGAESLKDTAATNEFLDVDYVTMATYYDGILSKEARVNELYALAKLFFEFSRSTS